MSVLSNRIDTITTNIVANISDDVVARVSCRVSSIQSRRVADAVYDKLNQQVTDLALKNFGKAPTGPGGAPFDYYGLVSRYVKKMMVRYSLDINAASDIIQDAMLMLIEHAKSEHQTDSNIFQKNDPNRPFAPLMYSFVRNIIRRARHRKFLDLRRNAPLEVSNDGETYDFLERFVTDPGSFEDEAGEQLYKKWLQSLRKAIAQHNPGLLFIFDEVYIEGREYRDIAKDFFPRKWGADPTTVNRIYGEYVPGGDIHNYFVNVHLGPRLKSDAKGNGKDRAIFVLMLLGETNKLADTITDAGKLAAEFTDPISDSAYEAACELIEERALATTKKAPRANAVPVNLITYAENAKEPFSPGKVKFQVDALRKYIRIIVDEVTGSPEVREQYNNLQIHWEARGLST